MNLSAWMLIIFLPIFAFAQGERDDIKNAAELFAQGRYQATVDELNLIENKQLSKADQGLIAYWKGMTYNRLQDFPRAIENFQKSLNLDNAPLDIHYEFGQALFASEKLSEARIQFRESLRKKFKRGVSLYYIAYISKELGDYKKAVTFYKAIDKLGEEGDEVRQAAQVQIGDIYLQQVEKTRDSYRSIEKYVIPQYQFALSLDETSAIAPTIREKILDLQRKYDLVMFKLRNGRPVADPPYILKASLEGGVDSNVTFAPTETTVSKSDQSSSFSRAEVFGRYTFYYRDYFSFSPEFRANRTYYFNRVPEIFRNDNYLLAPAVRMAYEHSLWDKPAAHIFDYEYAEARRDINAKKELEFSSRAHTLMIGERFNFFKMGESIFRLKHRIFESFSDALNSGTTSLIFEQMATLGSNYLLFYLSYDRTRVDTSIYSNDSYTFRTDFIMDRIFNTVTPSFGVGLTQVDPFNDKANRGTELLINPNARLTKKFGKRWRGNLKYDYQNYNSKDKSQFAYKKSVYSFELEYLF
jgi:tetratricopeptide (TPR) repeat protein